MSKFVQKAGWQPSKGSQLVPLEIEVASRRGQGSHLLLYITWFFIYKKLILVL